MRRVLIPVLVLGLLASAGDVFAQARRPQTEIFAGVAFPTAPKGFKDYYKVGGSLHGQYVVFPNPNVGVSFGAAYERFTFDGTKFLNDFGSATGYDVSGLTASGNASVLELGVGVRPYLTSPSASMQFFLFGMGTFNRLHDEGKVTGTVSGTPIDVSAKSDENKAGLAVGAGLEMPAGEKINIILQGLMRFIFTDQEKTTFVGVTGGVVF